MRPAFCRIPKPFRLSSLLLMSVLALGETNPGDTAQTPPKTAEAETPKVTDKQNIEKGCGFNPDETDVKKIRKANACIERDLRVRQERLRLKLRLDAMREAEARLLRGAASELPQPKGAGFAAEAAAIGSDTPTAPGDTPTNNFVGGSLSGTPSTCIVGNGISNPALIRVHREVMTPHTTADDFGYRLGRRFVVYQVTVENGSKEYQFMLQDVSVDFSRLFHAPAGTYRYSASGQDLGLLRGVPEKGQDLDPRNKILHVLQGVGSVAGAVSGLTSFADVMGPSIAIFNGSFIQGYTTLAPDHTATQLNRLSDNAFTVNTVIDKQRGKSIALFIPADELMSNDEQKRFRNDPFEFLGFDGADGRLNQADICVDGTFIQAVTVNAPTLSTVTFASGSLTAGANAVFNLTGSNMIGGDTVLVVGGSIPATVPVTAISDGTRATAQVLLPSDFDPTATTFTLKSKSNPALSSGTGIKLQVLAPALTAALLEKNPPPTKGAQATLNLVGANFVNGDTTVILNGAAPVTVPVPVNADGVSATLTVTLPADYADGTTTATLQSKSAPASKSAPVVVHIKP
ncbi:hypothetical protein [Terriglobus sp. ADX1]|uniref:hypothetical protein n=1 Tax=Terriglobus sp. ADX1 TaxID=2794063 RepID=UPI002FE61BC1